MLHTACCDSARSRKAFFQLFDQSRCAVAQLQVTSGLCSVIQSSNNVLTCSQLIWGRYLAHREGCIAQWSTDKLIVPMVGIGSGSCSFATGASKRQSNSLSASTPSANDSATLSYIHIQNPSAVIETDRALTGRADRRSCGGCKLPSTACSTNLSSLVLLWISHKR